MSPIYIIWRPVIRLLVVIALVAWSGAWLFHEPLSNLSDKDAYMLALLTAMVFVP